MLLRGWGTCGVVAAPGVITEILHDWARKVHAVEVTGGLGASSSPAPPLSQSARPYSIFGGSTREVTIAKNGGTTEPPHSFPSKDREQECDERGGGGAGVTEEDAGRNHGAARSAK
jgi:hypothetical protein